MTATRRSSPPSRRCGPPVSDASENAESVLAVATPDPLVEAGRTLPPNPLFTVAHLGALLDEGACSDDEVPAGTEKRPWRARKDGYLAH